MSGPTPEQFRAASRLLDAGTDAIRGAHAYRNALDQLDAAVGAARVGGIPRNDVMSLVKGERDLPYDVIERLWAMIDRHYG